RSQSVLVPRARIDGSSAITVSRATTNPAFATTPITTKPAIATAQEDEKVLQRVVRIPAAATGQASDAVSTCKTRGRPSVQQQKQKPSIIDSEESSKDKVEEPVADEERIEQPVAPISRGTGETLLSTGSDSQQQPQQDEQAGSSSTATDGKDELVRSQ
ncbi:hypothetical protein PENTCL1PPCAC_26050, partial [Pristionchus entomophagus]